MTRVKEALKDKKKMTKGIIILAAAIIIFFVYLKVTYYLAQRTDLDSDYSNLILEANDILHGNVFLTGWNQTGVSFLLTDLLYFIVGVAMFGVSKIAYFTAIVLMILATMLTTFFLTDYKNIKNNILFMALIFFPSVDVVCLIRAHTGGYIWMFIILLIIASCVKKEKINTPSMIAIVLLTALCAMSDAASLVFGTFAIIVVCIYKLIFNQQINRRFYGLLAILSVGGTALGLAMDKLYYIIGGANKNGFLDTKAFIEVEDIVDNIYTYITSIFTLGNANIFGQGIFDLDTIIACIYIPFVLIGLVLVVRNIKLFLRNEDDDLISVIISVGYTMLAFVFVFTTVGIDVFSSRYFATQPFFFAVLLCRYIQHTGAFEKTIHSSRIKVKYVLMAMSALLVLGGGIECYRNVSQGEYIIEAEDLVGFLEKNNLKNGYANYWDSSIITVASSNDIKIRQIEIHEGIAYQQNWFCKNDWYDEYTDFVALYIPEKDDYGVIPENVMEAFGIPDKTLNYGEYVIYKYNYDISSKVKKLKDM